MLFDKLSPKTDFISKTQLDFSVLNGNILYITHEVDKILKLVKKLEHDSKLQKQVNDYFEKDPFGSQFKTANKVAEEDEEN